jgi:endonuclease/exonuclease/phosphatase family metal-dependent hydrolase
MRRFHDIGFTNIIVPDRVPFFSKMFLDSGLMILSKYPITSYHNIGFTQSMYIDKLSNKGFQHCSLLINNKTIHVLNTHLQAPYAIHNKDADIIKKAQLEQIRSYMNSLPKEEDIVLCGDLNCNGLDQEQYAMVSSILGGKDLLYPKEPTMYLWFDKYGNVSPVFGQSYLSVCFDYIFLENQKCLTCKYCRVISSNDLSDHCGIECLFSF